MTFHHRAFASLIPLSVPSPSQGRCQVLAAVNVDSQRRCPLYSRGITTGPPVPTIPCQDCRLTPWFRRGSYRFCDRPPRQRLTAACVVKWLWSRWLLYRTKHTAQLHCYGFSHCGASWLVVLGLRRKILWKSFTFVHRCRIASSPRGPLSGCYNPIGFIVCHFICHCQATKSDLSLWDRLTSTLLSKSTWLSAPRLTPCELTHFLSRRTAPISKLTFLARGLNGQVTRHPGTGIPL